MQLQFYCTWSRRALWPHVRPQTALEYTETLEIRSLKSNCFGAEKTINCYKEPQKMPKTSLGTIGQQKRADCKEAEELPLDQSQDISLCQDTILGFLQRYLSDIYQCFGAYLRFSIFALKVSHPPLKYINLRAGILSLMHAKNWHT